MEAIRARYVDKIPGTRARGAFRYFTLPEGEESRLGGMIFRCPGCAEVSTLGFTRPTRAGEPTYSWDGDRIGPTLTPAISHECGWSGFLKSGVWQAE